MHGYDLRGLGAYDPVLGFTSNLVKEIKSGTNWKNLPVEISNKIAGKVQKLIVWAKANPKKAMAVALGTAAVGWGAAYTGAGVAIYKLVAGSEEEIAQKAGTLLEAQERAQAVYDTMLGMAGLTPEQKAEVIDKIDDTPGSLEWWHWALIAGGGIGAIFLVWFMFRGKKGGKRRRRR